MFPGLQSRIADNKANINGPENLFTTWVEVHALFRQFDLAFDPVVCLPSLTPRPSQGRKKIHLGGRKLILLVSFQPGQRNAYKIKYFDSRLLVRQMVPQDTIIRLASPPMIRRHYRTHISSKYIIL